MTALGATAGLLAGGAAMASVQPATATVPDVVVTVIDTGVRATHQEFDYGGASDTTITNLAPAIKWARETIQSDVVSISIGQVAPLPAAIGAAVYDQIELARQAGILAVVANGNGWGNTGAGPGEPGFAKGYANSPYALGVGAANTDGALVTTDPEVVSSYKQQVASHACDTCYTSKAG